MTSRLSWMACGVVLAVFGLCPVAPAQRPVKLVTVPVSSGPPAAPEAPAAIPTPPPVPVLEGAAYHGAPAQANGIFIPAEADYLLLRPRRRGQDYAIVGTNPNFAPVGVIKSVEGNFDSGFRVAVGYRLPCDGWEVRFAYTYFHTAGDDQVTGSRTVAIFPTLTHPTFVNQVTAAQAGNSINLNLYDLDVGRRLDLSETVGLRLFAGPRFASIDQKFAVTYTGGDVARDEVRRCLCFDGGGLRGGAEVNLRFFESLGVYLRGSGSLLAGHFHSGLSETADRRTVVSVSETFDKVIPVLDLGVGLSYQRANFRLTLGYELQNWFGLVEGFDFVDDAHPAKMMRRTGDLGFEGFVLRAEWMF